MFARQKTGRPVFAGLLALTLAFNVLLSGCRSGGGNVGVPGQKHAPQF
jgi:hypothetical protein